MINVETKKLPKSTYELTVKVAWEKINEQYKLAFKELLAELTLPGFRKGKVPEKIGEKELKKEVIYERLVRKYLPELYQEVIKKTDLKPIVSPKIEMLKNGDNMAWEFKFTVAEKPVVVLGNYKEKIKEAKLKAKKDEIWTPGKDKTVVAPEKDQSKILNEVLTILVTSVKCEVPDLVLEEEINSRLAKLVNDVQKVGLTVEKYLSSSHLTMDQLKERFTKEVTDTYKIEFILAEIADHEKITVEEADLNKIFGKITDEKEKIEAKKNAYFYSTILRKQKTIDFLTSL